MAARVLKKEWILFVNSTEIQTSLSSSSPQSMLNLESCHVRYLNIIDTLKMSREPVVYNSILIFTKLKRKSWESVD